MEDKKSTILDFLVFCLIMAAAYVLISLLILGILHEFLHDVIIYYLIGSIPGIALGVVFTTYWIYYVLEE